DLYLDFPRLASARGHVQNLIGFDLLQECGLRITHPLHDVPGPRDILAVDGRERQLDDFTFYLQWLGLQRFEEGKRITNIARQDRADASGFVRTLLGVRPVDVAMVQIAAAA